jgi:TrmH family RNA methyltransferase
MKKFYPSKPFQEITSLNNSKIKQWSQLLTKRAREDQGKFILEGIHLVQEALRAQLELEVILYSLEKGYPAELLERNELPCECIGVSEAVLAKCSDTQTPQGLIAIAVKPEWSTQLILEQLNALVVVVDGVQDPGNLGTIIRSADAVGATGVVLGRGTVDLYNPKTIRSTMGSLFHLPIMECDLYEILPLVEKQHIQLVSTSLQAEQSCYELDMTGSTWSRAANVC